MKASAEAIRSMFDAVSLGAPENAIGFVFWRITSRYQREIDRALEPIDLTNLQFISLALCGWFARSGQPVHQAQLARFGGIHPMQLSQMLKALETKQLIARTRSTTDSRAKDVTLTRSGLQSLRQALPLAIEVQVKLFGKEGQPGGNLHETLLGIDRALSDLEE